MKKHTFLTLLSASLLVFLNGCDDNGTGNPTVNNVPVIADQSFSIAEESAEGTQVGFILASDMDGDTLTYMITSGNSEGTFALDNTSGELSIADSTALDYEVNPDFLMRVEVRDGKDSAAEANITVLLTDVEEPQIYEESYFSSFTKTTDVVYGISATNHKMNLYEPENDTRTNRPVVLLLSGGGFYNIDQGRLEPLATRLVKHGFVVGTVRYRVGIGQPEPGTDWLGRLIDAQQDSKAAVRYLRKESENLKIDPDFIIIGGWSAGAITALSHAYISQNDIIGSDYEDFIESRGGLEGEQGNEGFSSDVQGVISLAGSLINANQYIKEGDVPVFAVHGTADGVVPIGIKYTADGVTPQYGSEPLVEHAKSENVLAEIFKIQGGSHNSPVDSPDLYIVELTSLFRSIN